jgi:uncharacterized membrane protein YedE/YeeE
MSLDWIGALAGGVLIGLSASALLWLTGRIAGVSGIAGRALLAPGEGLAWRLAFLAGLICMGGLALQALPAAQPTRAGFPPWLLVVAGLLVGVGTRMGNGCTSGHGVCGLALHSRRSLAAVAVFMGVAMAVTFLVRHVWRGS